MTRHRVLVAVPFIATVCIWHTLHTRPLSSAGLGPFASDSDRSDLLCRNLAGADESVVVLKTGATKVGQRLPVHISNTLRCYPNYLIFSDVEEVFQGEDIILLCPGIHVSLRPRLKVHERVVPGWQRLSAELEA